MVGESTKPDAPILVLRKPHVPLGAVNNKSCLLMGGGCGDDDGGVKTVLVVLCRCGGDEVGMVGVMMVVDLWCGSGGSGGWIGVVAAGVVLVWLMMLMAWSLAGSGDGAGKVERREIECVWL
ncbi:hypothetical protein Tco_1486265 [Tanacetum coccineum]